MSHTSTIKSLVIKDESALRAAITELQQKGVAVELRENVSPRMYYANQQAPCALVAYMKNGSYDVGFNLQKDGTYSMVMDPWSDHLSRHIGAACPLPSTKEGKELHAIGQLTQCYSKHAAINAATADGFIVDSCELDEEGNIQLTLSDLS